MHLIVIVLVLAIAWRLRTTEILVTGTWSDRWQQLLFLFLFSPLLLIITAVAIIYMGFHGSMLGIKASWLGYGIAVGFLIFVGCCLLNLTWQGYRSLKQLQIYPTQKIAETTARVLDTDFPYSAQVGFWNSQLVISRGLLTSLDRQHLLAVLAHEQAHADYRDTFWFFWLNWLRTCTAWLPNTDLLWQELLLLRELRADSQAAKQVDFLLLAESLLTVAQAPLAASMPLGANFNDPSCDWLCQLAERDRLEVRIDSLLTAAEVNPQMSWQSWIWLLWLSLPLLIIPLHY